MPVLLLNTFEDTELFREDLISLNPKQPDLFKRRKLELSSDSEEELSSEEEKPTTKRKKNTSETNGGKNKKQKVETNQKENTKVLNNKFGFGQSVNNSKGFYGFLDEMKPPEKTTKTYSRK